jgi:hypothetical protein
MEPDEELLGCLAAFIGVVVAVDLIIKFWWVFASLIGLGLGLGFLTNAWRGWRHSDRRRHARARREIRQLTSATEQRMFEVARDYERQRREGRR